MSSPVCVVGAGPAGAGVADALRDSPREVTVLEADDVAGGRAATRRVHGVTVDPGANYVKTDPRTDDVVADFDPVTVDGPVWTFDADGRIEPGDRDEVKYTWRDGIRTFVERALDRSGATVRTGTRVERLTHSRTGDGGDGDGDDAWKVLDTEGRAHGPFGAVVLAPPGPETAEILASSEWPDGPPESLVDAAASVPFRSIRTFLLGYPDAETDADSWPWYALVNTDREHEIGWLAREECKPGHVDAGSVLVVQMSPEWSAAHFEDPVEEVGVAVVASVARLVGDDALRDPAWVESDRWRHAIPDDGIDESVRTDGEKAGIFVAGDWVVGAGRVHEAFRNGYETGRRLS